MASNHPAPGIIIRWPFFYDLLLSCITLGREGALRESWLDLARVSPGERVLDVGCGTGTLTLAAKQRVGRSGKACGVDAGEEMVAMARRKAVSERLDAAFSVSPAQTLPFSDGSFDVALCTLALHHLPDGSRLRAVTEMRRVLRPGGRLLIVDFALPSRFWAALNPIGLFHDRRAMSAAQEAESLARSADFADIVTGKLASGFLGYVLGAAAKSAPLGSVDSGGSR